MNDLSFFSKHRGRCFTPIAAAVVLVAFIGCMQAYGHFRRDAQVDQAFKNGAVPPDFNYYYLGRDTKPNAIIGVDPVYTVSSHFWIAFEPQPEQLKTMSKNMSGASGSNMLDPDGTVIGVWFSNLDTRSVKVDQQKRSVEVIFIIPSRR